MKETGLFHAVLGKPFRYQSLMRCLGQALKPANPEQETSSDQATKMPSLQHALGNTRILLVEDNRVNQKLAIRMLNKLGYTADLAVNGREAVELVQQQTYDVVFMDVQMPELDGISATRQIRSMLTEVQQPIIIAMTANAMEGDREKCLSAGMNDYLSKPFRMAALAEKLTQYGSFKENFSSSKE